MNNIFNQQNTDAEALKQLVNIYDSIQIPLRFQYEFQ